jgi:hypothetical protein
MAFSFGGDVGNATAIQSGHGLDLSGLTTPKIGADREPLRGFPTYWPLEFSLPANAEALPRRR